MKKVRGGVRVDELTLGNGETATREHIVHVSYKIMLHRGESVRDSTQYPEPQWIDLGRRDCIAGLRYGIEGMRVGGRRRIEVPPHLAYGPAGIPGAIPPNAMLICEVELIALKASSS